MHNGYKFAGSQFYPFKPTLFRCTVVCVVLEMGSGDQKVGSTVVFFTPNM